MFLSSVDCPLFTLSSGSLLQLRLASYYCRGGVYEMQGFREEGSRSCRSVRDLQFDTAMGKDQSAVHKAGRARWCEGFSRAFHDWSSSVWIILSPKMQGCERLPSSFTSWHQPAAMLVCNTVVTLYLGITVQQKESGQITVPQQPWVNGEEAFAASQSCLSLE